MDAFSKLALGYGYGITVATWSSVPRLFGEHALGSVKAYARHLKNAGLAKTHSIGLEAVSRAAGFQHWHELNTLLTSLIDDDSERTPSADGGLHNPKLDRFAGVLPFLGGSPPDVRPSKLMVGTFEEVARRLSPQLNCQPEQVLDMIGRIHKAADWDSFLKRDAANTTHPLYEFLVSADGKEGAFSESPACGELVREQDEIFQGYDYRTPAEQKKFAKWLDGVLEKQPGFLEGWLARGTVYERGNSEEDFLKAGACYDKALAMAHAMIPEGFKGEISWYTIENRFYHRLLYASMVHNAFLGDLAGGVALARRQLSLNPSDNLGVRFWLVALLASQGNVRSVAPALRKLGDKDDIDAQLEVLRSIGSMALGDRAGSAAGIIRALLHWPSVRWVLMSDQKKLTASMKNGADSRGVIPDAGTLWDQYAVYSAANPGFVRFVRGILEDRRVLMLEAELSAAYRAACQARDQGANFDETGRLFDTWIKATRTRSEALSIEMTA